MQQKTYLYADVVAVAAAAIPVCLLLLRSLRCAVAIFAAPVPVAAGAAGGGGGGACSNSSRCCCLLLELLLLLVVPRMAAAKAAICRSVSISDGGWLFVARLRLGSAGVVRGKG